VDSPVVDLGASGPGRPIYLVHPIGGGVLCYGALARGLDGSRPVFGLQAAGLEGESQPETDLARMASHYVDALRARDAGRYILSGWSMGGIVAFEMARQLAEAGHDVPLVILIDSSVPVPRNPAHPFDEREALAAFAADLARTADRPIRISAEQLRHFEPDSIRNGTWDPSVLGRELAGELGHDRLRRLHSVFRANRVALDAFEARPYRGRVVLVRAGAGRDHVADRSARTWNTLAPGGVTTHHIAGDHYSIMQQPAISRLAEILSFEILQHENARGAIAPR
jgi:thioesterase domain-containing protein